MQKILIVSIPMTANVAKKISYLPGPGISKVSDVKVSYPILAYLAAHMTNDDNFHCLLIKKKGLYGKEDQYLKLFQTELDEINQAIHANISYENLESDFRQEPYVHERLMENIIKAIPNRAEVYTDITYGPKDTPLVIFAALNFAEKHLQCNIKHIIYGQGYFDQDQNFTHGSVCDMMPLYSLNSLTNAIPATDPQRSRSMLEQVLDMMK